MPSVTGAQQSQRKAFTRGSLPEKSHNARDATCSHGSAAVDGDTYANNGGGTYAVWCHSRAERVTGDHGAHLGSRVKSGYVYVRQRLPAHVSFSGADTGPRTPSALWQPGPTERDHSLRP